MSSYVTCLIHDTFMFVLEKHVIDRREAYARPKDVLYARPLTKEGVNEGRGLGH